MNRFPTRDMGKSFRRESTDFPKGFNFSCEGEQYNVLTKQFGSGGKKRYKIEIRESGKAIESLAIFSTEVDSKEELQAVADIIKSVTAAEGSTLEKVEEELRLRGYLK